MARQSLERLDPQRFPQRAAHERAGVDPLAFIDAYHLAEHQPALNTSIALLRQASPSRLADSVRTRLAARVASHVRFHEDEPFVVAPPHVLNGPITLGEQVADSRRIGIETMDVVLHEQLVGPSGSGKTTALQLIANGCLREGLRIGGIDIKEDLGWLLRRDDVLLVDEHTRWNFLQPPWFLTPAEHRTEVIDLILARLFAAESKRAILDEGWIRASANHNFSIEDWISAIKAGATPRERASLAEARDGAVARLERFRDHALFTTHEGISWDDILRYSFIVRARGFDDIARLLFDLIARYWFLRNRSERRTAPNLVLLVDESYEVMSAHQNTIRAIETLPKLKQLAREFGIGVASTTVTLDGQSTLARASTHIHLALPPNNRAEARTLIDVLGLDGAKADYFLHRMTLGEGLLRIVSWPEVVHLRIPPGIPNKHATPEEIATARARTNQLVRTPSIVHLLPASSLATAAASEECESNGQPTPSHTPATSSSPPSRVASVVENTAPNGRKIALNRHATSMMSDVAEHYLTLTTPCSGRCGLRLSEGDRAKTLLVNVGFLECHRVRTGRGRGKTGTALRLTPAGWKWLGRTPTRGTRGGDSVQHAFLVHELARRIPRSTIETLGADLVIPYNATEHTQLRRALEELSARAIALNDGDLIALEIESTRPELTAPRNVKRDAGFALTVIATLGKIEELQQRIGETDRVVIVDVLRLLDQLRSRNAAV